MQRRITTYARHITLALAITAVTALAGGCDNSSASDGSVVVGFVSKAVTDVYFQEMIDGAEAAADESNAEILVEAPSTDDAQAQIALVESMISRNVDALAVAPVDPAKMEPVLQRAADLGIPVVIVDTDMPDWDDKTAYVGTNNVEAGRLAGEYVAKQLGANGGKVVVMTAAPGVTSVDDREQGFTEALEGVPGVEIETTARTMCTQDQGLNIAQDMVTSNPDVAAVFSPCDPPAIAAVDALEDAGKAPEDVVTVGFDAIPAAVGLVKEGGLDADVAQFPIQMGTRAVQIAEAAARGEEVDEMNATKIVLVTEENADTFSSKEH